MLHLGAEELVNPLRHIPWQVDHLAERRLRCVACLRSWEHDSVLEV